MTLKNKTKRTAVIISMIVTSVLLTTALTILPQGYAQSINTTSLKAYYKFNEASGNLINLSPSASSLGSAADGVNQNGVTQGVAGKIGNAYLYDGINDATVIGTSTSQFNFLHNTAALWTINMWVKLTNANPGTQSWMLSTMNNNANVGHMITFEDSSGEHAVRVEIGRGVNFVPVIAAKTSNGFYPADTSFHMITITYDQSLTSNNMKFCLDGNLATCETFTKSGNGPSNADALSEMRIANRPAGSFPFSGTIDELSIWNRVLSDQEITELYNNGAGFELDNQSVTCNGLIPTITGTSGNDVITGTLGNDIIVGLGGNDLILGMDGNDTICGGDGDDLIRGGEGDDYIDGDGGKDLIMGDQGNDTLKGSGGDDRILGGSGADTLKGNNGEDMLSGGSENDSLDGGNDNDVCDKSEPSDTLVACEIFN